MITDGGGHNTWRAASMFRGKLGKEIYDQPGWIHLYCSTYPLVRSASLGSYMHQDQSLVYSPAKAWEDKIDPQKPEIIPGYNFLMSTCTDSAAAATALSTGIKTYAASINWSPENKSLRGRTIAEIAKSQGKSVGVVTSVPWSHATPAGLGGAHHVARYNFVAIANEMLDGDWLDVIMGGGGNPDFDHDGRPIAEGKSRNYDYVGGSETWKELKQGCRDWKLIETKKDFAALVDGSTPAKVLGTAQVAETLQARRKSNFTSLAYDKVADALPPEQKQQFPFSTPMNDNVPTLAVMTKAALNCLDDDPEGLFLMIEGGAVDWANHANEPDRMIEEQIDFVKSIEAVVEWVESRGGWDETLLILTADHETGLIWGPDSQKIAFQPIKDRGKGNLPGMRFNSHNHTNSLVPLFARGMGSRRLLKLIDGVDEEAAVNFYNSGQYVDNTNIFEIMRAEIILPNCEQVPALHK